MDTSVINNLRHILKYDSVHPFLESGERLQLHLNIKQLVNERHSNLPAFYYSKKMYEVLKVELPEIKYQREFEGGPVQMLYRFENMKDYKQTEDLKLLIPKIL